MESLSLSPGLASLPLAFQVGLLPPLLVLNDLLLALDLKK